METTLTKWLSLRMAGCLIRAGIYHPHDLLGKSIEDLYRLSGFGHSAFHEFVKHMWDMNLRFDHNGILKTIDAKRIGNITYQHYEVNPENHE